MTDFDGLLRAVVVANQQPNQKDAVTAIHRVLEELVGAVKAIEEKQ
jgi:hypothetical protein